MSEVAYHHNYPYYCGGGYYYGHYGYYPYGFSFSVAFGYPYYGWGWGWGGWPYYHSVNACYPYYGYYFAYPYPYLGYYPYYDCSYYDGYYVRFGYYRRSYYVTCSGFGDHGHCDHHCHYYDCSTHGYHYYHVQDCSQCYPAGEAHVHQDADVPPPSAPADTGSPAEAAAGASSAESRPEVASVESQAESAPVDAAEAFFASLKPAQLSFAVGLLHLRSARYDEAVETLYNASLEDPESKLAKVFLGIALFGIGEYSYSAEYLRAGLEAWPAFPAFRWDVRELYGAPADFDLQLATLEEEVRLNPASSDAVLVLAFLHMSRGTNPSPRAGPVLDHGTALATNAVDREILERYVAQVDLRQQEPDGSAEPLEVSDASVQAFLTSLELRDVPTLPLR